MKANKQMRDDVATPTLLLAVHGGREEEVRNLLATGVDVNLADADGITPLMASAMNGNITVARLLLDSGACRDRFNKWGMTARAIAIWHGYSALAAILDEAPSSVAVEQRPVRQSSHS